MRFNTKVKVLGMKSSKGTMDNGQAFDSTKAYILIPMDTSKGNAKGLAAEEITVGTSAKFAEYERLVFPFDADADMEIVSNGKTSKKVVHALVPVPQAAGKAG